MAPLGSVARLSPTTLARSPALCVAAQIGTCTGYKKPAIQPLDFAANLPSNTSSRWTLRWSVLRMICGSRPLPMDPPDTATEIAKAVEEDRAFVGLENDLRLATFAHGPPEGAPEIAKAEPRP
jgi:hypothetical protein